MVLHCIHLSACLFTKCQESWPSAVQGKGKGNLSSQAQGVSSHEDRTICSGPARSLWAGRRRNWILAGFALPPGINLTAWFMITFMEEFWLWSAPLSKGGNQSIVCLFGAQHLAGGSSKRPVSVCVFRCTNQPQKTVLQVCSHWGQMFAKWLDDVWGMPWQPPHVCRRKHPKQNNSSKILRIKIKGICTRFILARTEFFFHEKYKYTNLSVTFLQRLIYFCSYCITPGVLTRVIVTEGIRLMPYSELMADLYS